jgi:hypothetical protein
VKPLTGYLAVVVENPVFIARHTSIEKLFVCAKAEQTTLHNGDLFDFHLIRAESTCRNSSLFRYKRLQGQRPVAASSIGQFDVG